MSGWPTAPLRDLCEVNIGRTPSRNEPLFWGGSHPWASIRDLASGDVNETREQISDEAIKRMPPPAAAGTLLASFKLTIGRVGIARRTMHHNEAIAALPIIRPDLIDRDYLLHSLPRVMLAATANNAVLGKVLNKGTLTELPIPLPPLEEQRRIVSLLDRAADIRHRADDARAKARAIIPALFLDTFGDPATNPKSWRALTLGDALLSGPQNGLYPRLGSHADQQSFPKQRFREHLRPRLHVREQLSEYSPPRQCNQRQARPAQGGHRPFRAGVHRTLGMCPLALGRPELTMAAEQRK